MPYRKEKNVQPLRREHILADLMAYAEISTVNNSDYFIGALIDLAVMVFLLCFCLQYVWAWFILVPCAIYLVASLVLSIYRPYKQQNAILKGDFKIRRECLKLITHDEMEQKSTGLLEKTQTVENLMLLHFDSGIWQAPEVCYPWSELYRMSHEGLDHTSVIGNEFYVVIYEGEVCAAYNTKLFTLEE